MIPEYSTFIRHQDKKLIPYLYFITLFVIGLYWKNSGYRLPVENSWCVSIILTLILFNFIYELRCYWAYKCVIKNINFKYFEGTIISNYEIALWHPIAISALCCLIFYLLIICCQLLLPPAYAVVGLVVLAPLLLYIVFRVTRHRYVKQMREAVATKVKYKNLHGYVCFNVATTYLMNGLLVSPLGKHDDFSLSDGYFSARLMIAMLIVCAIVVAINLLFTRTTRCYAFLGRLFLKEVDFNFSGTIPFREWHDKPLWVRLLFLLLVQISWIVLISVILSLAGWYIYFIVYFVLCIFPSIVYFYLHVYWLWHNDYMMACDMYLRYGEIDKSVASA